AEDGIRDFHVTGVQTCALPIFFRGEKLAVLDVDYPARLCGGDHKVGLHAQICRNLENINGVSCGARLIRVMNICEHGESELFTNAGEELYTLIEPRTRVVLKAAPVILLKG